MATKTNAVKAQEAKAELEATNEAIAKAKEELAEVDEQIEDANTTLDDTKDELGASEKKKLEKEANQPSADKYKARAKAFNTKGKNGKPLIGKGTGYEITLNKK
jgi:chromosome segregation ATPase